MNTHLHKNEQGEVKILTVKLSERNLRTLLLKRAGHPPNSACALQRFTEDDILLTVTVEDDEVHYEGRPEAGEMHPETERELAATSVDSLLNMVFDDLDDGPDPEPNPLHQGI